MPAPLRARPEAPPPTALDARAMDNLRFIRDTMARAGGVTAISGWGIAGCGVVGLAAALLAARAPDPGSWLATWLAAIPVALASAVLATLRKARRTSQPVLAGAGRKLLLVFVPPMLAGALLTLALARLGAHQLLPATWLLLYGSAVVAGGAFSVRPIPVMGLAFLVLGAVAILAPAGWGNALLTAGFGGLHLVVGPWVARHHDG